MKTIQCAHPLPRHNGFVATCRLWMASGGVYQLLVLEPTECSTSPIHAPSLVLVEHSVGSNTNNACTPPLAVHSRHVPSKPLW